MLEVVERKYRFETSCVNSTAEKINAMKEAWLAQKVSFKTFFSHVDLAEAEAMLGYDKRLRLRKDWHVGYYKSVYDGKRCYFLIHSAIEYIWVEERE